MQHSGRWDAALNSYPMKTKTDNYSTLQNKKVIVLGASSGLGLATAKAAANEGAKVIIVSGNPERINAALKELPAGCEGYAVDLREESNIRAFFEQTGNFDHLVYTAGGNISRKNVADLDLATAQDYFRLRFWAPFAAIKYGTPYINTGGSITLTSGIAGQRPGKGWSLGAGTSGAMEGLTRAMAVELAPIRVNVVSPGVVKTNLWSDIAAADREDFYRTVGQSMLVGRIGEPEDIAQTYLYLMKQPYSTGQVVIVDGGAVLV
jgi:NAD(P)-dependent dehydrogenase (short-subunit alcohol dehydrogenase family)